MNSPIEVIITQLWNGTLLVCLHNNAMLDTELWSRVERIDKKIAAWLESVKHIFSFISFHAYTQINPYGVQAVQIVFNAHFYRQFSLLWNLHLKMERHYVRQVTLKLHYIVLQNHFGYELCMVHVKHIRAHSGRK